MFVSVVCPTYKRHRYIPFLIKQFNMQTYDATKMELIIFDDSPNPYGFDEIKNDDRIIYIYDNSKHFYIWEKRNILNEKAKGDIIICMDDDDIQSKYRVEHSVEKLCKSKCLLAGYHGLLIYNLRDNLLYDIRHEKKNHILNCTFAYKKELLKKTKYLDNKKNCAEEKSFTKNFTEPTELLNKNMVIICVNHMENTIDKTFLCKKKLNKQEYMEYYEINNTLQEVNICVYWINLRKSRRRFVSMKQQLENVINIRIDAVENSKISHPTAKKAEIGCFLSHINAIKEFHNSEYKLSVICEDDLYIKNVNNFNEIIFYYSKIAPEDWEILQLYTIYHYENEQIENYNKTDLWSEWKITYYSTLIYIINKKGSEKIINTFNEDQKTNFMNVKYIQSDKYIYSNCKTYTINLPYFQEKNFESTIHKKHKSLHDRTSKILKDSLKDKQLSYPFG
jgi:GR25 family glycosyltransferase involved in LPS biosynthesis